MPRNRILRIGILGCGRIASSHAAAVTQLGETFKLVAAADPDEHRRRTFGDRFGVEKTYASAAQLCESSDIDAVIICSPNSLHAVQSIAALDAGKHVLVEKPMADTAEDAARMAHAAQRTGLVLALGHTFRHCDAMRYVADHVHGYGKLRAVEVSMCVKWNGPQTDWWAARTLDEGLILSLFAPHALDFVHMIMGDDPLRVHVEAARHQAGWAGEDEAMILLAYPERRLASVHVSYNQDHVVNRKTVHCESAFVRMDDNEKVWVNDELVVAPHHQNQPASSRMGTRDLTHYFADQLKEFAAAIGGKRSRCILHDEGVRFTKLLDRVRFAALDTSRDAVR